MCVLSAEEILERLKDKYCASEIVDLLDMTVDDLADLGFSHFIAEHIDELAEVLEEVGVLDET